MIPQCWICSQPHWGDGRSIRARKVDAYRLDCGHREPDLIPHWKRQEAAQTLGMAREAADPLKSVRREPAPVFRQRTGFRAEVTENDAFAQRRG